MLTSKQSAGLFVTLLLFVGLLTGCARNVLADAAANSGDGTITVVGRGQALGEPDQARAQVGVEVFAQTVQQAANENEATTRAIMKALEEAGIATKDIQTSNYSLWAEQRYNETGSSGIVGYRVSNQVNITIRDFSQIGEILAAVIDAGANNIFGLTFAVADPTALEAEARAKAIADARDRATELAKLGAVELGDIKMISEVISQPSVPPYGLGGGAVAEAAVAVPSIAPGQMSVDMQVQVTYSIK